MCKRRESGGEQKERLSSSEEIKEDEEETEERVDIDVEKDWKKNSVCPDGVASGRRTRACKYIRSFVFTAENNRESRKLCALKQKFWYSRNQLANKPLLKKM